MLNREISKGYNSINSKENYVFINRMVNFTL